MKAVVRAGRHAPSRGFKTGFRGRQSHPRCSLKETGHDWPAGRTATVRYSAIASRMNWISCSLGCGASVISDLLSAGSDAQSNEAGRRVSRGSYPHVLTPKVKERPPTVASGCRLLPFSWNQTP